MENKKNNGNYNFHIFDKNEAIGLMKPEKLKAYEIHRFFQSDHYFSSLQGKYSLFSKSAK